MKRIARVATIVAASSLGGCPGLNQVGVPTSFPATVMVVEANKEQFSMADHPLKGVTPGTVLDELSSIDGCWGRYAVKMRQTPAGAPAHVTVIQVLSFDVEEGSYVEHELSIGHPLLAAGQELLATSTGTFRIRNEQRLSIRVTASAAGIIVEDGGFTTNKVAHIYGLGLQGDSGWLVTIEGDHMARRIALGPLVAERITPEEAGLATLLYTRLDCDSP